MPLEFTSHSVKKLATPLFNFCKETKNTVKLYAEGTEVLWIDIRPHLLSSLHNANLAILMLQLLMLTKSMHLPNVDCQSRDAVSL